MASLVARTVVAAAALPSERARRLGSERLPLAALPGHGAVVLAGRSVGARHGGVLAIQFKAPGRAVKAACNKDGANPPSRDEVEYFEKMYKIRSKQMDDFLALYMPLPNPLPMSKEEKAVQVKLKEIAEKCIALIYDAMRRLPRAEMKRLDSVFWTAHFAFAVVRSRATDGRASMGMAVVIAEKLQVVLKMVSSGRSTPLPLDIKEAKKTLIPFTAAVFPSDHGVEVLVFHMIDNLYKAVKKDIDAMISDASRD